MTRSFDNPNKLGFLRLIQAMFAFNVVGSIIIIASALQSGQNMSFSEILSCLNLSFDGVAFWLIWKRKAVTKWFVIGFALLNIIASSIHHLTIGTFTFSFQFFYSIFDIILVAYFLTSRRVKALLTQPMDEITKQKGLEEDISLFQPKSWPFWRNLIIYFCVFSVVGHWLEAGYCTFIRLGILPGTYDPNSQIWHDWLYPFMVYGVGAVACVLLLFPVKNFFQKHLRGRVAPLAASFVVNALVCTSIELIMGLMLNQPLPDGTMPLWDYRDMFCNFMGQICLQNAVAFGIAATLMTWIVYPGLESILAKIPRDAANALFVAVVIGFVVLLSLYYVNVVIPELTQISTESLAELD